MAKKKIKKSKGKKNGINKLHKRELGYFVCPKCGLVKCNPIHNAYGYPMGYYDSTGELRFAYKCMHDEEEMKFVDKSLLPVAMLLNKLEIGFIDYIKGIVEEDVVINPYIAIKAEDISPKGEKSLEMLEPKLSLTHWKIDKRNYKFEKTTTEYEDSTDKDGRIVNKPVKKTNIIKFHKLTLNIDDKKEKSPVKYKKKLEKGLKTLTEILQEIYKEG